MAGIFSKENIKFAVLVVFIGAALLSGIYYDIDELVSAEEIEVIILSLGLWGPVAYVLLYVITSLIFFPAALLSVASGAMWGAYLGTLYTVIAAVIASIAPFYISRGLGRGFAGKLFKKQHSVDVCDRFVGKQGLVIILLMRLIPIFPWDAVNFGAGLCSIRFRDYILATFIGTIPASFVYNLIGSSFGAPVDMKKVSIVVAIVVAIAAASIVYKYVRKK